MWGLQTLGLLTHSEPYLNDVRFLIKVSDALDRCSRDAFIAVRLKAFFALAHLCERAFIIPAHATSEYLRHHAGLTLVRLADMAMRSIDDHDKVRVYGARALGYLAHAPEFVTLVQVCLRHPRARAAATDVKVGCCCLARQSCCCCCSICSCSCSCS
jgi:hypothetical protein